MRLPVKEKHPVIVLLFKPKATSCSAREKVVLERCRHVLLCESCQDSSLHGEVECEGCRRNIQKCEEKPLASLDCEEKPVASLDYEEKPVASLASRSQGKGRKKVEKIKTRLTRLKRRSAKNCRGGHEYEVETILDEKVEPGHTEYLLKWKGYNAEEDNTWEHEDNLDCEEALQMFRVKQIRKEVGDERLAELLLALVEILAHLPCCRAGERVVLQQSCHLLQCGGCGEAWLHGQGCGRCRPSPAAGSKGAGNLGLWC